MRRARAHRARIRMARGAAIRVRVEHPDDAAHARFVRPAARIAGQHDGAVGRTVVRAIASDDLVAAGGEPRELDRVLVRLRPRVREERHAEVARRDLLEQPSEAGTRLRRHRRPDRAQLVGLLLDRRDDLRVLVPDVDVDELRREVEVARSFVVPEVATLRAGDRDRVDRVLCRPRVEDVLLRVLDDLRSEIRVRLDRGHRADRNAVTCAEGAGQGGMCPAHLRAAGRQRAAAGRSSCPNAARSTNSPTPGSASNSPDSTRTFPRSITSSGDPVTSVPS